jgi:hypothetical protein
MANTTKIDRRTLIHSLAQSGLALSLMPGLAESAWSSVAAGAKTPMRGLSGAEASMIPVIADIILPRSDTPSATDLGVPAWIDAVVAEYFSDAQRLSFVADLAAINNFALVSSGARVSALKDSALAAVVASLDAAVAAKNPTPAQRGYAQLKELVIVGYFTSKPVQTEILKVVVIPGRYDPNVPMAPSVK